MYSINLKMLTTKSNRFHEHPHVIQRKWLDKQGTVSNFIHLLPKKQLDNLSFYFHIPFCDSECSYCKFYHVKPSNEVIKDFRKKTIKCLRLFLQNVNVLKINLRSINFGGGSPPLAGMDFIDEVCFEFHKHFGDMSNVEISAEMRPRDIIKHIQEDRPLSQRLNRISFGIQTFAGLRQHFNRIHNRDELVDMIHWLQKQL